MIAPTKRTAKWHAARRARFRYALMAKGVAVAVWCHTHGVTHTHLNYVLRGLRESRRLDALIYGEIAKADPPAIAAPFAV